MTHPSGLPSTRRRTSQRSAIAKDRADDERAGPALFYDQGGSFGGSSSRVRQAEILKVQVAGQVSNFVARVGHMPESSPSVGADPTGSVTGNSLRHMPEGCR